MSTIWATRTQGRRKVFQAFTKDQCLKTKKTLDLPPNGLKEYLSFVPPKFVGLSAPGARESRLTLRQPQKHVKTDPNKIRRSYASNKNKVLHPAIVSFDESLITNP